MMQQPQIDYGTWPCPHCGFQVPGTMPAGMRFPCPGCQQNITAPAGSGPTAEQAAQYQQWALQHGNTAAAQGAAQIHEQTDARRANFSITSNQVAVKTREGVWYVIGSHVDDSGKWCLRAQDVASGAIAWETAREFYFQSCPDLQSMGAREGVLYLAQGGSFRAIDASTGKTYWNAQVPRPETVAGTPDGDEMDLHVVNGVLIIRTNDERIIAINAQNGQLLWQRQSDNPPLIVPGAGVVIRESDGFEYLAGNGQTIASFRGDGYGDVALCGQLLVVKVDDHQGAEDDEGVLLISAQNGQVVKYFSTPGVDMGWNGANSGALGTWVALGAASNMGGAHVYVLDPNQAPPDTKPGFFASFFGGQRKRWYKAVPGNYILDELRCSDDAVVIQARTKDGEGTAVLVLDPSSMQVRFDSGLLPFGESSSHFEVARTFVVYVTPTNDDRNDYQLHCVSTTNGQLLWSRPVGHWSAHWIAGDRVVVYHDSDIVMLRPEDGAVIGSYPHGIQ